MSPVSFIGTGLLGSALAEAAATRGDQVTVWNRTNTKSQALKKFGVTVAPTAAEAVRGAHRIHLVLKDDAVVNEVIAAMSPGLAHDAIICDHTTTQPALTAERSARLNAQGIRYLHCPVFIGPAAARKSEGSILVSGPQSVFDQVHAALSQMCGKVQYYGERPDLAAAYKLFGNALIIGLSALAADVFTVAAGVGISPVDALAVLDVVNPANTLNIRGRNMARGDYTPTFELDMARKDVRLMIETAGALPLAALPSIAARMDALIAAGHGADDLAVIGIDAVRR